MLTHKHKDDTSVFTPIKHLLNLSVCQNLDKIKRHFIGDNSNIPLITRKNKILLLFEDKEEERRLIAGQISKEQVKRRQNGQENCDHQSC